MLSTTHKTQTGFFSPAAAGKGDETDMLEEPSVVMGAEDLSAESIEGTVASMEK